MAMHKLDVLSLHQRNIIFLLCASEFGTSIAYFLLLFKKPTLTCTHDILLHAHVRVSYDFSTSFASITKLVNRGVLGYPIKYYQREIPLENIK